MFIHPQKIAPSFKAGCKPSGLTTLSFIRDGIVETVLPPSHSIHLMFEEYGEQYELNFQSSCFAEFALNVG